MAQYAASGFERKGSWAHPEAERLQAAGVAPLGETSGRRGARDIPVNASGTAPRLLVGCARPLRQHKYDRVFARRPSAGTASALRDARPY